MVVTNLIISESNPNRIQGVVVRHHFSKCLLIWVVERCQNGTLRLASRLGICEGALVRDHSETGLEVGLVAGSLALTDDVGIARQGRI